MFHKHQHKFQLLSIKTFLSYNLTKQVDFIRCYLSGWALSNHFSIPEILSSYGIELKRKKLIKKKYDLTRLSDEHFYFLDTEKVSILYSFLKVTDLELRMMHFNKV